VGSAGAIGNDEFLLAFDGQYIHLFKAAQL
jgi:hypothetical protein